MYLDPQHGLKVFRKTYMFGTKNEGIWFESLYRYVLNKILT